MSRRRCEYVIYDPRSYSSTYSAASPSGKSVATVIAVIILTLGYIILR